MQKRVWMAQAFMRYYFLSTFAIAFLLVSSLFLREYITFFMGLIGAFFIIFIGGEMK